MPRHHQKQGRRPRRRPFSISHTAEPIPASPAVQGTITDPNNDLTTDGYETTEIVETFPLNTADEMQDAFEYDAAGNLTFDGKAKYTYDAYNRLIMVQQAFKDPTHTPSAPGSSAGDLAVGSTLGEYAYDAQGRRIRKSAYTADGLDNVEHFYYTGWSVVETRNGSDQVTQQHVWDNLAGHYIDSLAQVANNTNPTVDDEVDEDFYALQDQQFNVLAITDNAGSIVERYEYTLYGERTVINPQHVVRGDSAHGMTIGFQGLFHDTETGLIQNRRRPYSPRLGRFLTEDPLGYPDGLNTYAAYHVMHGTLDPYGLRTSGNYNVTGTGHHIIPVSLWEEFGFPDEAKAVFDEETIAVFGNHNGLGHGVKTGYNAHVQDEIVKFLDNKGISGAKLTVDEYVDLAQDVVKNIRNTANPYIAGFNTNVHDPKKLRNWLKITGRDLPKPKGSPITRFQGFRKIELPKLCKVGRKVPVLKYVFLVGVTYLWSTDYNNARADGYTPFKAGSIATARAADPGVELAWDFGWAVGSPIGNAIANQMESGNNYNLPSTLAPTFTPPSSTICFDCHPDSQQSNFDDFSALGEFLGE